MKASINNHVRANNAILDFDSLYNINIHLIPNTTPKVTRKPSCSRAVRMNHDTRRMAGPVQLMA